ncbi:hypothetical protein DFH29DRAFT_878390 [Suillus ampliporus]|nr:hypothetical protein DFH29DRAFT_878390 [Suillus ampliporus]
MSQATALYVDAGIQGSKYSNVGMFAILVFDYCITLEAENLPMTVRKSQWVWHRKWTLLRFEHNTILAKVFGRASKVLHIICVIAAEGLLITRVYASWAMVFPVVCFVGSYILSDTPLVNKFLNMTTNIPDPGTCLLTGERNSIFEYVVLLLYELDSEGTKILSDHSKKHFSMIHHDFVQYHSDYESSDYMGFYHRLIIIHSVLASRILFNIRESEEHSWTHSTLAEISEIQFGERQLSVSRFEA